MINRILLIPFNENDINRFQGQSIVLKLNDIEKITQTVEHVKNLQIDLKCILIKCQIPLVSIPFQEEWQDIPIALYVPSLGLFRDFINKLPILKKLNIKVYLTTSSKENYTSLRILSSLGINSVVVFDNKYLNWELLSDLMTYSLLGLVKHAPIEPFHFIASHYEPTKRTDFGAVYFEDPSKYLHVDEKGHVALSQKELKSGKYIAKEISELNEFLQSDKYIMRLGEWKEFFLQTDGCAYCQGWRVCLGKFSKVSKKKSGCKKFFSELMDVVEQFQSLHNNKKETWQP